ncbi:hypothetical protein DENIS_2749 [Desulfonema ishimotonii]|uniref:Type I restriction enzyme R protein N-terminal domain-containing protein n=1 Tax=Desulfonema ishimotonii TaxID=45657 RepID=A0A401FXT3_9BACT|nr:type I restriction enzyme HsdR N-terminal domain-containing protein [Desulfonema ishimotonii]GBC61787.1 hypothetical protein DENIS_2749 [Desulfonema ishimotonii]
MTDTIVDFITGKKIPDVGAEANRQEFERFLVEERGYAKADIEVDVPIEMTVKGEVYTSVVDLVVCAGGKRFMAVRCAPGSLGSREREIVSAARLLGDYQIPLSVVSDGKTAIVWDTVSGKKAGEGLAAVPSGDAAAKQMAALEPVSLPEKQVERERLIFRSYDSMNVNRNR